VWGVGVAVYFVAVIFRTSLGVAGIDAADRFGVNASALSTFSILQLLVYAAMQIPVGLLVDRLGTKRVLTIGVLLFTTGQLGFALSSSYGMALISRALLGCGDAMTFISVLRLGAHWFPARKGPLVAQVTSLCGMAGNFVSTLVLSRVLHGMGWTAAFAGSVAAGPLVLLLLVLFLKDHPEGREPPLVHGAAAARLRCQIAHSWREPGTRLGAWVHFTTQFPSVVFLLLWGMPFLVEAQHLSRETAAVLMTLVIASNMVLGLVYGQIIARHPCARTPLALATIGASALLWAVSVHHLGDRAPLWVLITLCTVLGACAPASMIGFDFASPANPPERQGTASGIVNMSGSVASTIALLAVGLLHDATGGDYQIAFSSVFLLQALGVTQILRLRKRTVHRERERLLASDP
jgi:MFS family permease